MAELRVPVLLVDADSNSCGDQNIILGLRPNKILSDLCDYTGPINNHTLRSLVTPHKSGIHFIGAVYTPDQKLAVDPGLLKKQIQSLSQAYKYIVLDLGTELSPPQMSLIELCTVLCVITTPEILVVNQTLRIQNELLSATVPSEMIQIIINKFNKSLLSPNAISSTLKHPILGLIPQDDITTNRSLQSSTPFILTSANTPLSNSYFDIVRKLSGGLLQKLDQLNKPKINSSYFDNKQASSSKTPNENKKSITPKIHLKLSVHKQLIEAMDLKKGITDTQGDPTKESALRQKVQQMITQIVGTEAPQLSREERSQIIKEVLDEALGLGPLEDLLADKDVTEIMVNGAHQIYIEKKGRVISSPITFTSNAHLRNVIERIVTPLGRRIDEKTPYQDARLQDGSRVNAIIEPLSIDGPALTIRKFSQDPITAQNYIEWNSITKSMLAFLKICVENGLNIVISGGTGSGKTTLLNVLSSFIPSAERIITIEDAAELQLKQEHIVRLETRPANIEGSGSISIRDLIKNSLRMRPDRIVVGETRDGAALDMLQAMNTGHDGSMTTVHANSPRESIGRLETLCLMSGMELPIKAIREQVSSAVHLIVQISRLSDGSRKVISITEVVGMQGDTVTLQEVFRYKEEGFDKNRKIIGQFQAMGLIPTFIEKLEQKGIVIPRDMFSSSGRSEPQIEQKTQKQKFIPPQMNMRKNTMLKKVSGDDK